MVLVLLEDGFERSRSWIDCRLSAGLDGLHCAVLNGAQICARADESSTERTPLHSVNKLMTFVHNMSALLSGTCTRRDTKLFN